jgi:tetratricopeptide (TPR) repeat protein
LDPFPRGFVTLGVLGVLGLVYLLHYVYFLLLPRRAIARCGGSDPERLRRYLERVVATPSLLGAGQKLIARSALARIYLRRGQHAEVVAHCRANLESMSKLLRHTERFRALEAEYRRQLADSLEALGRVDEAAEERRRAEEGVERAPADTLRHLTQGKLLEEQNRHEEAYGELQKALDLTPASNTPVRIECMIHLLLTAHRAGRPAECLRWAEEAIALGAKGTFLHSAHRMAGLACGNLGRLEESERHIRHAYDAAAAEDNRPAMAEALGSLASCLRKLGRLAEAADTCARATAMDPQAARMALAVQTQIFHAWGRYDDALATMERHREPLVIPRLERRMKAVRSLDRARLEAECGRADDAWRHIHEAHAELRDDVKLGFKCEAALCWVLAARGDADESQRLAASLEPRLAAFERDPGSCRGVLYDLGMAACARGDHAAGIDCWTRYLTLSPDPVYRPDALYHRGESYRQLGRFDDARNDYQAAVAMGLDTHFSRLAGRRLGELALS